MQPKVLFIAPLPGAAHGQSLASLALKLALEMAGFGLKVVNTESTGKWRIIRKLRQHAVAAWAILSWRWPIYISANSNAGMWLTTILIAISRLRGSRVFLHHHAYSHIRIATCRLRFLLLVAGPRLSHIVLSGGMAEDLARFTQLRDNIYVINNAGLVIDDAVPKAKLADSPKLRLGHLSNLSVEKGLVRVIDTAVAALAVNIEVSLTIGGPCTDQKCMDEIDRAKRILGTRFEYLGPLYGEKKRLFLTQIDVFLFPSEYKNEAAPLVLLEAMAAGVPSVAIDIGCIREDLAADDPFLGAGIVSSSAADFENVTIEYLRMISDSTALGTAKTLARARFTALLKHHNSQLALVSRQIRDAARSTIS